MRTGLTIGIIGVVILVIWWKFFRNTPDPVLNLTPEQKNKVNKISFTAPIPLWGLPNPLADWLWGKNLKNKLTK